MTTTIQIHRVENLQPETDYNTILAPYGWVPKADWALTDVASARLTVCRSEMQKHGFKPLAAFIEGTEGAISLDAPLGCCLHDDAGRPHIFLNECDWLPELDFAYLILHELAHGFTPDHGHDKVWQAKALELGYGLVSCALGIVGAEALAGYYDLKQAAHEEMRAALIAEKKKRGLL